jgi:hypothetical protein
VSIASEHAGEAADTLRVAAGIADPYLRADAIWEALLRIDAAAEHLCGYAATRCAEIARGLEAGCKANEEPPRGEQLLAHVRVLEAI